MPVLTDYLSSRGELLVLILVIVLSVTLMFLSTAEKSNVVRAISDTALTPVQVVVSSGGRLVGLRAENDSLRVRLAHAALDLARLREQEQEAVRLRALLEFRESTPYLVKPARVIAREAARLGSDYKIDKGERDGLRKDLAVMTLDGLMGKITAVEPRSAFVRPLTASNCRVSARLERTRTEGILAWSKAAGLYLSFLPFRTEAEPAERVVTSGLGGVFPRGIVIGEVTRTETQPADGSLRVLVEPIVDFSRLEEVFVVLGVDEAALDLAQRAADSLAADAEN